MRKGWNDDAIRAAYALRPDADTMEIRRLLADSGVFMSRTGIKDAADRLGIKRYSGNRPASEERADAKLASTVERLEGLQREAYKGLLCNPVIRIPDRPVKFVHHSDLHGNFWDMETTEHVIAHDGDAEVLVVSELLSMDSFAHFRKTYPADTLTELSVMGDFLERVCSQYKVVVLLSSNHDIRAMKWAIDNAGSVEQSKVLAEAFADLFEKRLRLPKYRNLIQLSSFVAQLGEMLITHFSVFRKKVGDAPALIGDHCVEYALERGIREPVHGVMHAHTHRVGKTPWPGHRGFCYETGAGCHVPRYLLESEKLSNSYSTVHSAAGYGAGVLNADGSIDFQNTEAKFIKWTSLPKWAEREIHGVGNVETPAHGAELWS